MPGIPTLMLTEWDVVALARVGDFWYPVRLIQYKEKEKSWLVRWWRGCSFVAPGISADKIDPTLQLQEQ